MVLAIDAAWLKVMRGHRMRVANRVSGKPGRDQMGDDALLAIARCFVWPDAPIRQHSSELSSGGKRNTVKAWALEMAKDGIFVEWLLSTAKVVIASSIPHASIRFGNEHDSNLVEIMRLPTFEKLCRLREATPYDDDDGTAAPNLPRLSSLPPPSVALPLPHVSPTDNADYQDDEDDDQDFVESPVASVADGVARDAAGDEGDGTARTTAAAALTTCSASASAAASSSTPWRPTSSSGALSSQNESGRKQLRKRRKEERDRRHTEGAGKENRRGRLKDTMNEK